MQKKRKTWVLAAIFILYLITVWIADDIQQRRFRDVSNAYSQMEAGNYTEARDGFE